MSNIAHYINIHMLYIALHSYRHDLDMLTTLICKNVCVSVCIYLSSELAGLVPELALVLLAFCTLHTHGGSVYRKDVGHTGVNSRAQACTHTLMLTRTASP